MEKGEKISRREKQQEMNKKMKDTSGERKKG